MEHEAPVRVPTGIIDDLIMGGIPLGSIVLLKGAPKAGKSVFTGQTLYNHVKMGIPVIGLAADQSPEETLEDWRGIGFDFQPYKSHLYLVDIFTRRLNSKPGAEPVIEDPYDVGSFIQALQGMTLRAMLDHSPPYMLGFVSSVNSLFRGMRRSLVYDFLVSLRDFARKSRQVWILEMNWGIENESVETLISAMADGVIELGISEEPQPQRYLRVYGMNRTHHVLRTVPFSIERGGIKLKL
ncbi:RAD55 family ATPase [Palaeococcus ferrophilus]|uniref:RAD55 family ATPase n=1 Tax=Palaeococcus ferrophilus TaxID=83868 RepID=UPI00064F7892|nr:RAD55 family ATPase [Palaeococcus ferrophilus]